MTQPQISLEERVTLLARHPMMSLLEGEDLRTLAKEMHEREFAAGDVIVREADAVDAFYFIFEGTAKVVRHLPRVGKVYEMDILNLHKGDSVGFSAVGVFSSTGLRSATVYATSALYVLYINLPDFYQYLTHSTHQYPDLKNTLEKFIVMNFLVALDKRRKWSIYKLEALAEQISKKMVPEGTELFAIDTPFLYEYYLVSGTMLLTQKDTFTSVKNAGLLTPSNDSLPLYTHSAKAQTPCEVLQIEKKVVKHSKSSASNGLVSKIILRLQQFIK